MATPTTPTWRMADSLAGGQLAAQLVTLRESGTSWRRISTTLLEQHGIDVTDMTLADWHRQLVDTDAEATA